MLKTTAEVTEAKEGKALSLRILKHYELKLSRNVDIKYIVG